ncbi:hypothetical protein CEE37_13305 [candidate division LCP-89 bacterium B3_LCP]|uniref:Secretion system C-terminal sorting domain-containing protein n=1 Tax=candidate division LCP-89 bacterium B3_LCP TaxID=2012998 RepID=A0A532USP4_UNCL8|nr:MAG: hypothetical protein CEE37_13305 [candidate division LCP-89 bacterium B3_LCP]
MSGSGFVSEVHNCIMWDCDSIANQPDYTKIQYSDLENPYPGLGNISEDPLFVDPGTGNFTLDPASPCIDTGNPGGFWYDHDSSRADMGITGGSGFVPYPTTIDFPPLWPGEQMDAFFDLFNLNSYNIEILDTYFTYPDNFSFFLDSTEAILSPYEKAKYTITYTGSGYECSADMVINSEGFTAGDTASIHLTGLAREFTTVSGIWTVENSPYYYNESLIVEDGQQLIIEPGVVVYMDSSHVLKIEGNLVAQGIEGDTIRLSNLSSNDKWGGLIFDSADGNNILEYVKIKYVTGSGLNERNGGCISAENSLLYINHCLLNSQNPASYEYINNGGGLYLKNCDGVTIDNSTFYTCYASLYGGGIYAENCTGLNINTSEISYCNTYTSGGGIYIKNSICEIDSCVIYHASVGYGGYDGIGLFSHNSNVDVTRTVFKNCSSPIPTRSVLALDQGSTVAFDHSDICFNNCYNGYAITVLDDNSEITITNSIIYDVDELFEPSGTTNITMTYSIAPEIWPGTGNLVGDPLITPECYLTSSSPCIDAGDPTFPLDPDSTRTDMGAYCWEGGGPISGAISGIWTAENNPYQISGDTWIPENDTLRILPGTVMEWLDIYNLDIYGVLLIEGTEDDSVMIIGADPTYSEMVDFYFNSQVGASTLANAYLNDIFIHMGPTGTMIEHSTINGEIFADGSLDNVISYCVLDAQIIGGANWTVTDNEFDIYRGGSEVPSASAYATYSANGTFINNYIDVYARASGEEPYWQASSYGFRNCTGEFAHNTIYAGAYAGSYSSYGIRECIGTIRHNCADAITTGISRCSGDIYNNTIINANNGIYSEDPIDPVRNNIIHDCDYGFYGPFDVQYSCVYNCTTPYANGATAGVGTIEEDPLLISTWFLDPNSPCIDAGDPDPIYNDPDGTRDDMGANYFDQGAAYATVALTPYGTPIQIPVTGGSFDFNIAIANLGINQVVGDVWCNVILPNGNLYGPLLGPVNLTLPGGFQLDRDRSQIVPGSAPEGTYTYQAFIGLHPDTIWDMDSFTFEKLTTGDGTWVEDWSNSGESFDEWLTTVDDPLMPETYSLEQNYPNPFNPTTVLSYKLQDASKVNLSVYDISGRLVTELVNGWRDVGVYEVMFDGSDLSSGVYLYRLNTDEFADTGKMLLLK